MFLHHFTLADLLSKCEVLNKNDYKKYKEKQTKWSLLDYIPKHIFKKKMLNLYLKFQDSFS